MRQQLISHLQQYMTPERYALFQSILEFRTRRITTVLEDLYQPHNASAVLRTCDCFGIQDVHIIEQRNEYTVNPEVSLGSSKWLDLHRYNAPDTDNTRACIQGLRSQGYTLVATSPHVDGHTPEDLPLDRPVAIILGTEGRGLSQTMLEEADLHLRIPMYGFTESFNISVSAAMIIHRLSERMRAMDIDWRLSQEERENILIDWMRTSIRNADYIIAEFQADNT